MQGLLNLLGLIYNIAGVFLLFRYGFPQPSHGIVPYLALEDKTPLGDGRTAGDVIRDDIQKERTYKARSQLALILIILGFIFQAASTIWALIGA